MNSDEESHSGDELDSDQELEYAGALIAFATALIVLGGAHQCRVNRPVQKPRSAFLNERQAMLRRFYMTSDRLCIENLRMSIPTFNRIQDNAIYGDDNAAGDESVGVNDAIQDNASINLDEDEEEADEATPQPHVSDNSTRQPSSTATKRRKTRASSSQGPSDEVYVRIASALEDLSSSFKDKIHRNAAFEGAIDELIELGLDEFHLNTAVTLLAGNKGYAKAFMLTRRERRVGYVIGLLTAHGFL